MRLATCPADTLKNAGAQGGIPNFAARPGDLIARGRTPA
jgi:hypothetical protein